MVFRKVVLCGAYLTHCSVRRDIRALGQSLILHCCELAPQAAGSSDASTVQLSSSNNFLS